MGRRGEGNEGANGDGMARTRIVVGDQGARKGWGGGGMWDGGVGWSWRSGWDGHEGDRAGREGLGVGGFSYRETRLFNKTDMLKQHFVFSIVNTSTMLNCCSNFSKSVNNVIV